MNFAARRAIDLYFGGSRFNENHDPDTGQFTSGSGGGSSGGTVAPTATIAGAASHAGFEFVSPNVQSDLDFAGAVEAVSGDQQQALREASVYINGALGIHAQEHSIIGAWADGAENSVMDVINDSSWDKLVLSGSMKGYIADQKQVLIFQQEDNGAAALSKFEATGTLETIHKDLLADGLAFHTLVPHAGGATVYVVDLDGTAFEAVEKGAERYDSDVEVTRGRAEFLGTQKQDGTDRAQRDDARSVYQGHIDQSPVQGSKEVWARVRDRWGASGERSAEVTRRFASPSAARAYARYFTRYNENHDPDTGEFTSGSGGSGSGDVLALPAPAEPVLLSPPALNTKAIDVGGDQWNKDTAVRLETEYARARPALDAIVETGVGEEVEQHIDDDDEEHNDDDAPYVPEEWGMLSTDQQDEAKTAYIDNNKQGYIDSEIENWQSEHAEDEAREKVAQDFTDESEYEWASDTIDEFLKDNRVPYSADALLNAVTISHETGNYPIKKGTDIDIDAAKLEPDAANQPTLPGIEPGDPKTGLTSELKSALIDALNDAFEKEADSVKDKLEPPEYLAESAEEFAGESWDQMDEDDKFKYVENNTNILDEAQKEADNYHGSASTGTTIAGEVKLPEHFDPLEARGGTDYRRTQVLATYMSLERQKQLLEERGVDFASDIKQIDNELWSGWKSSSTNFAGSILQLAAAKELGGRYRDLPTHQDDLIKQADAKYKAIGGFAGVKALVRAKWEVTQFLLDKADVHDLDLYRGLKVDLADTEKKEKVEVASTTTVFQRIEDTKLVRNGAMSTTTDRKVANGWGAGTGTKVVMRLSVPRTAVISVPAYGINVHSEHEVVVAGTAYGAWDLWKDQAPSVEDVPIRKAA